MALPDPQHRIGAHARRHLLAGGARDDERVSARGLDDLDLRVELRDRPGVAVDAFDDR